MSQKEINIFSRVAIEISHKRLREGTLYKKVHLCFSLNYGIDKVIKENIGKFDTQGL